MDSKILGADFECPSCKKQKIEAKKIPIARVIEKLDEHFKTNDLSGAVRLLDYWIAEARAIGDLSGELSVVNEQLGLFRKTNDAERADAAVKRAIELIEITDIAETVSGATIMLNAATTLKAFGGADRAVEIYENVEKIYKKELDECDLRNAAFFNNFATTLVDLSRFSEAEALYLRAIALTELSIESLLDCAVSYVNLAHLYEKWQGAESEKIEECLARAEELILNENIKRDAYYAFVCEKCAPVFDYFGFFVFAEDLRRVSREIYEGA